MGQFDFQQNYGGSVEVENPAVNQPEYTQMNMAFQMDLPQEEEHSEKRSRIDEMLLGVSKDEMRRIDLNKADIVRRQYLSHIREAMVSIRPDGLSFNNACISKMLDTYYIQLYIDRSQQLLIIRACDENDKDGQKWCNEKNGDRKSRKITGKPFAEKLYKMMGWSKGFYYKVCGVPALQIDDEDELLFVFELKEYERYALTAKGRKAAGVSDEELEEEDLQKLNEEEAARKAKGTKKKNKYPDSWDSESFGSSGADHANRVVIPRIDDLEASTKEEFSGQRPIV